MATNNACNQSSPIQVAKGGTGQSSLTQYGVLVGNGTSGITQLTTGTDGSILIGQGASSDPVFSTTANIYASSATINSGTVFNKYTQSTWTPQLLASSVNPTVSYNYQVGRYTRIGNRVFINANISVISISGGTGAAYIGNLPIVPVAGSTIHMGPVILQNTTLTANRYYTMGWVTSSLVLQFYQMGSAVGYGSLNISAFTSTSTVSFSLEYEV